MYPVSPISEWVGTTIGLHVLLTAGAGHVVSLASSLNHFIVYISLLPFALAIT
jgi:hypothetical protein